jgi:hypothetical protein
MCVKGVLIPKGAVTGFASQVRWHAQLGVIRNEHHFVKMDRAHALFQGPWNPVSEAHAARWRRGHERGFKFRTHRRLKSNDDAMMVLPMMLWGLNRINAQHCKYNHTPETEPN